MMEIEEAYEYCDVEEREYEPIMREVLGGKDYLIREKIAAHPHKLNSLSFVGSYKYTPLLLAISIGRSNAVKILLENGADPFFPDEYGNSPIRRAFKQPGKLDIIYHLLNPKLVGETNVRRMLNACDFHLQSALHYAARLWCPPKDRYDLIEYMIEHGAIPYRNAASKFPSESYRDENINKLLKQHEEESVLDDDENMKHDKVGIKLTSANSKFPSELYPDEKYKKPLKPYEGCGLPDICQQVKERLKLDEGNYHDMGDEEL